MEQLSIKEKWEHFDNENVIYLDNGKVIMSYSIKNFDSSPKNCWKLENVYVQDEYRNNGLFYILMNDVFNKCKEGNCKKLWIEVYKNAFVIKKYKKLGFRFYSYNKTLTYNWMKKII